MGHTNVSSCVLSIVASFTSGLDVFKSFREKRKRRKWSRSESRVDEEELQLSRSLRRGPEDIGREYQKSIQSVGDHFAIGDAIAQTSLAEILLKLNTGLVSIIGSFLDRDKANVQLDYRSLTDLSEQSRMETISALRQWYQRMMQMRMLPAPKPSVPERKAIADARDEGETRKKRSSSKHTKVRGPTIARIVVQDSSRPAQLAVVKPGQRRKKRSLPSSASSSDASKSHSEASTAPTTPRMSPPPEYSSEAGAQKPARPATHRSKTAPEVPKPRRKQSAANMASPPLPPKPEELRSSRSTPRLRPAQERLHEPIPPVPATAPLPSVEPRRRKPTPTYYSIASDSTKLGEIPMHKWAVPYDWDAMSVLNKEAELNGCPVSDRQDDVGKKRRFGLFKLFKRRDSDR